LSDARVCAVVVTFDRKAQLVECLAAIFAQTHPVTEVYVVDNASTDGTADLFRAGGELDRDDVHHLRMEENRGSSGGVAAGISAAREADADWIWLVDDDAAPAPDALERMLASPAAADPAVAALCPAVVRPDGAVDTGHRGHFRRRPRPLPLAEYRVGATPELGYFTFVGPLLRMSAARAADPPREDFFIWCDDYEYSFRIAEHGRIRLVPESRILHHDVGQAHSNRRSRFWNRLMGWSYVPTPLDAFWRNLCGVRNYVWIKKRYEGQSALASVGTIAQFAVKALLYDERPLRRLPWILRFGIDGRRGRFRNFTPAEWRRRVR